MTKATTAFTTYARCREPHCSWLGWVRRYECGPPYCCCDCGQKPSVVYVWAEP